MDRLGIFLQQQLNSSILIFGFSKYNKEHPGEVSPPQQGSVCSCFRLAWLAHSDKTAKMFGQKPYIQYLGDDLNFIEKELPKINSHFLLLTALLVQNFTSPNTSCMAITSDHYNSINANQPSKTAKQCNTMHYQCRLKPF